MDAHGMLPQYYTFIISSLILASAPMRLFLTRFNSVIPLNFVLIILACVMGFLLSYIPHAQLISHLLKYGSITILRIYQPIYIFSKMYNIDFYVFKKFLLAVLILSFSGIGLKLFVIALTNAAMVHQEWSIGVSLFYALAYIPSEPSDIIIMFNDISKNKVICTMLESEAVLTLIPLFLLFDLMYGYDEGVVTYWYQYALVFVRMIGGGALIGFIFGKIIMRAICVQYKDPFSAAAVCMGFLVTAYITSYFLFNVSGSLAIVVISLIISRRKHNISNIVDSSLSIFFGFLHYIINLGILMVFSAYVVMSVSGDDHYISIYYALLIYFTAVITRFSVFLTVGWLLSKLICFIGTKQLIILAWSGVGGSYNMILVLKLVTELATYSNLYCLLVEILCYCLFSLIINCTTLQIALRVINIVELSSLYTSNLKNCLRFITERRINIIHMLKLNRYLSNANWTVVRNETTIKHKIRASENDDDEADDDVIRSTNTGKCPDCLKDIPHILSESEVQTLMREARVKIIKAKRVSIVKQYENGVVSKHVYLVLIDIFESILENTSKDELFFIRKYFYKQPRKIKTKLKIERTKAEPPKNNLFRRICYYIMMHEYYEYVILTLVLMQIVICICDIIGTYVHFSFYCIMVSFFIADCIIKVFGYSSIILGLKQYLLYTSNTVDIAMLILQLSLMFETIFITELNVYLAPIFLFLTFVRLLTILISLVPFREFQFSTERGVKTRVCFGYELTTALLNCYEELLDILPEIIEVKKVRDHFLVEINKINRALKKEADNIQMKYPSIAITVKTRQVISTTLKSMDDTVRELKCTGFVDGMESLHIRHILQRKQKALQNMTFIQPSSPKVIFKEVPWMVGNDRIIEFLYKKVETVSWNAGDVICQEGKFLKGIYIVVTGLLKITYIPGDNLLQKAEIGQIPIVDYLSTLQFDVKMEDNITSGNTIGELSLLTGRPYDCTIVAESPSQAYLLTFNTIAEAMKLSPSNIDGLESRMWKYAAFHLGLAVLMDAQVYQSFTQEQIKLKIQKSFVPQLGLYKVFTVTDGMEDIILVEGIAADYEDGTIYTAPTLIPKSIQKLYLPNSSFFSLDEIIETKLLIVPNVNIKHFNVLVHEGEFQELKLVTSSKCLLHLVKDKLNRNRRSRSKKRNTSYYDGRSQSYGSSVNE